MTRRKSKKTSTTKCPTTKSWFVWQDIPGKGKGLVATKNIPRGTRILSEKALITMPTGRTFEERRRLICQQLDGLNKEQRNAFISMHNAYGFDDAAEQYLGIYQTNCLPAEEIPDRTAIFLEARRINHDCENNALHHWNDKLKRHMVHAIKDIDAGEEITLTYVPFLDGRETRQKRLKEFFSFTCVCRLCSLPKDQSQERDRKLEQISRTNELLKANIVHFMVSPLTTLGYLYTKIRCYNELGRQHYGYAQTLEEASTVLIAQGDLARGGFLAQKVASICNILLGNDHQLTEGHLAMARDPSRHPLYGLSMKWKTALEEAPQGLEPDDFEDWLWRRPKPECLAQPTRPFSQSNFSGFVDLPYKNSIDASVSGGSSKAPRPCFLGEIVAMTCQDPLDLEIKDIHNKKTTIHFYTKDRGCEFGAIGIQRGYTVAVLDASRYDFKFGPPGIRHEDPRMIKVIASSAPQRLALASIMRHCCFKFANA
ncbi:hypothetical protein E4U23_001710 [Claviceps purpurea]|nr:hypothetical protein E4U23_001710 [Claviceps purpurea]